MPIPAQSIHDGKKEPTTLICGPKVLPLPIRVASVWGFAGREREGSRRLQELNLRIELDESCTTQLASGGEEVCERDRKSTRLNSSHSQISYAVFCLKKKKKKKKESITIMIETSVTL